MLFIFWSVLVALGLARTVRFIVKDTWPPIEKLRTRLFIKYPPKGLVLNEPEEIADVVELDGEFFYKRMPTLKIGEGMFQIQEGHWFGELFDCHHCFGGWAAIPASFWWYFAPGSLVAATISTAGIPVWVALITMWTALWGVVSYVTGKMV